MPTIDDANRVGSTINNWLKIGGVTIGAIASCTYAYYLILTNAADISDSNKEIGSLKADLKRQYGVFSEKQEKKEQELKQAGDKFMEWMLKHEERLNSLEKDVSYSKGWREAEQFYTKNKN